MATELDKIRAEVTKYIGRRNTLITDLNEALEKKVSAAQLELLEQLIEEIASNLDTDRGKIKNNDRNRRLLIQIDTVFDNFASGPNLQLVRSMVQGAGALITFNADYAGIFAGEAKLIPITAQVTADMKLWLGLSPANTPVVNGYLDTILKANNIRSDVKQFTLKNIQTQTGYNSFKANMKEFIGGKKADGQVKQLGKLEQYYRNYTYDTYSQIDRQSANHYAEALDMNYAIYEGGLIATSRKFCKDHNGKVYTRDEISKFKPTEAIPANYNPFTDIGGFGCRHHYNWITYELAVVLRPDLKKAA